MNDLGKLVPCPRCGVALEERNAARAKISACRRCGGVWLPKDAARTIIDHVQGSLPIVIASEKAARAASREMQPQRTACCPWDAKPLSVVKIEGVKVDACPVHGMWFDAGEVRVIANAHTVKQPSEAPAATKNTKKASEPFDLGTFIECLSEALDRTK